MEPVAGCLVSKDTRQPWEDPVGDLAAWGRYTGLPNPPHPGEDGRKSFTDLLSEHKSEQ